MRYWLVYELQEEIDAADLPFTLHVVVSEDMPPNSVNGPCETLAEVLGHMMTYFEIDEQGFMRRK